MSRYTITRIDKQRRGKDPAQEALDEQMAEQTREIFDRHMREHTTQAKPTPSLEAPSQESVFSRGSNRSSQTRQTQQTRGQEEHMVINEARYSPEEEAKETFTPDRCSSRAVV